MVTHLVKATNVAELTYRFLSTATLVTFLVIGIIDAVRKR